uniref:Uncharacterized protein n=1 Tax=Populus trichocarpa TaxID=3694 RepID=A0A2K2B3P4_POPTR
MVDGTTCRKTSEIHAVVPYQGRGRAEHEVDLDPESLRMWNQLVKIYSGVDEEKEDGEREQWWRRELLTFQGRIDLFISLLHQVLETFYCTIEGHIACFSGDRRFKLLKIQDIPALIKFSLPKMLQTICRVLHTCHLLQSFLFGQLVFNKSR